MCVCVCVHGATWNDLIHTDGYDLVNWPVVKNLIENRQTSLTDANSSSNCTKLYFLYNLYLHAV